MKNLVYVMTNDPDSNELSEDLQSKTSRMLQDGTNSAWAVVKEIEAQARAELTLRAEWAVRKLQLLEKINKQLQSIQKLIIDIPNVS